MRDNILLDNIPRYAPSRVIIVTPYGAYDAPVLYFRAHPPKSHPVACPLRQDCTAVELVTRYGSRWYGCAKAWINSELRMVVQGFDSRFEEMNAWTKVEKP